MPMALGAIRLPFPRALVAAIARYRKLFRARRDLRATGPSGPAPPDIETRLTAPRSS